MTSSTLTLIVWGLLGAAALGLWWVSRRGGTGLATPGEAVRRLATGHFLRVALVLACMWTGWHLFAR